MNINSTLFSIGNYKLKINHLLVFSILCLSFSISFLIRILPAYYGWELNEFDPFFNFRATQYIVENGINSYFSWNDDLSWYPHGRDISSNSQVALHIIAAVIYWIFGGGSNLYDFTIIFPVIFGSLSVVLIFLFVRTIGGTGAGLVSSLLFSISTPILIRGSLGWFKSEPLGLFLGIFALYLFLSGIKSKKPYDYTLRMIFGGVFLSTAISSWGGMQFFVIPIGIFILILPFIEKSKSRQVIFFSTSLILSILLFERPGLNFVTAPLGLLIIFSSLFLTIVTFIKNYRNISTKNLSIIISFIFILFLILFFISDTFVFNSQYSFRYYNSINPFLTNNDPLVDSISEHSTPSIHQSFFFHTVLLIFSGIGVWFLISNKTSFMIEKKSLITFSLIFGILGAYISSTFLRLEVFASLSLILLSSLGISFLLKSYSQISLNKNRKILYSFFCCFIILILLTPLILAPTSSIQSMVTPATILNGGTHFNISSNDWIATLNWIKNNTDKQSVILSWWDYGYWIQTLGERPSISDNSTLDSGGAIKKTAKILSSDPEEAWKLIKEMESDYVVIFVSANRLTGQVDNETPYTLGGGGDESKRSWFYLIAGENPDKFVYSDGISGTDYFWNQTLLGKMIPFSILDYVDPNTMQYYPNFVPGTIGIYKKDIKFNETDPFKLVYSSPSFNNDQAGPVLGVFVYEINKNYVPMN